MTDTPVKHYPWTELKGTQIESRIYCPKCGQSKVIEGNNNAFWMAANSKVMVSQCDSPKCRSFITIKPHKGGVEVIDQ